MDGTMIEAKGAAHCEVGPSTLPARAVCPCHDPAVGGAAAEGGTRAHREVEARLKGGEGGLPGATADEAARGAWGAAEIRRLRDETAPGAEIHAETRVEWAGDGGGPLAGKFGTVDAWWEEADGKALHVADFKTFASADGEKCYLPQGMMYAALLASARGGYERAAFHVVAAGDRAAARYDFTLAEARAAVSAIIERVEAVRGADRLGIGGDARRKCGRPSAWCGTCAHAADCPAISRAVGMVSGGGILERPLAVRMAVVPVLESFIRRVREEVRATLDAGGRVRDDASGIEYAYAMRHGKSRLADLRGLAEAAVAYGVRPEDFAAAVTVSRFAVDALMREADGRLGRKSAKGDREAAYSPFFTAPPLERYVKRIS